MEIIPAIDIRGGRCVRLYQGDYARETVFSDDPVAMARRWQAEGAPRLHLVDLDGARDGEPVNADVIEAIVCAVDIPCQVGGGIRSLDTVEPLPEMGVERVILGTVAVRAPAAWWPRPAIATPAKPSSSASTPAAAASPCRLAGALATRRRRT